MSFHIFTQIMMANTTQSIEIPFLPTSIWGLMTGLSLILVLLACGMYVYYHNRLKAVIGDSKDVADLAAKKEGLEAEINQCQDWLKNNREELLKLDAERKQQEALRQELANLQTKAAQEQQKVDDFSKESTILQNVISTLAQDRDRITKEIDDGGVILERNKNDVEESKKEIEKTLRQLVDVDQQFKEKKKESAVLEQKVMELSTKMINWRIKLDIIIIDSIIC